MLTGVSALYHHHGFYATRKYVEQFANGYTIMALHLCPLQGSPHVNDPGMGVKSIADVIPMM